MWYSGKGDFLFEANKEGYDDDDSSYDDNDNGEIDDDSRNSSTAGSNTDVWSINSIPAKILALILSFEDSTQAPLLGCN